MSDLSDVGASNSETRRGETNRHDFSDEEISQLKEIAQKSEQKWWRNYPFLVSLLAFLLSLSTAILSVYVNHRKDINDQLSQLATTMQTIQELNLKQVEIHEKYKNTPYEGQASLLITAQVNNSLLTASDLAFRLGSHTTTAALSSVGQGLYGMGDYARSQKLLEMALEVARSANDESIALRGLGFLKIRNSGPGRSVKEGEELFLRAANLEQKYDLAQLPEAIAFLKAVAQLQWAVALAPVNCEVARTHFVEGVRTLNSSTSTLDLEQLRGTARNQMVTGIGGVAACRPAPGTPPIQ